LRASSTEFGVMSRLASTPSFLNNPFSCATQYGQLDAPAKATTRTWLDWAAAGQEAHKLIAPAPMMTSRLVAMLLSRC
jgi:hypothetical protein